MIGLIKSRVFRCVWEKNQYVGVALQPSYESTAEVSSRGEKRKGTHVSRRGLRACVLQSPTGLSARHTTGLDKHPGRVSIDGPCLKVCRAATRRWCRGSRDANQSARRKREMRKPRCQPEREMKARGEDGEAVICCNSRSCRESKPL